MNTNNATHTILRFIFKNRQWEAAVRSCRDDKKLYYDVMFYPLGRPDVAGQVRIDPPRAGRNGFWKQHLLQSDENVLDVAFINTIGEQIGNWQVV